MELDYYHQKVSVQVALRVAKFSQNFKKSLGSFKKVLGMLGFDGEYLAGHPKVKF